MSSTSESVSTDNRERLLDRFRAEDGHQNPPGYRYQLRQLFDGVDLAGKQVLEIGSGRGLLSLHCGVSGAARVVSVEPEMEGSTSGVVAMQQQRIDALGLNNVELLRQNFHEIDFGTSRFDVIVMIAVLNHLYETPVDASSHPAGIRTICRNRTHLHNLLHPGGVVIATDACRYCLWTQLRRVGWPRRLCLSQRDHQLANSPATLRLEEDFLQGWFRSIGRPIPGAISTAIIAARA